MTPPSKAKSAAKSKAEWEPKIVAFCCNWRA
jgi:hypothetical protein